MRVMGLDFGTRTVGVALSDALCMSAQPCETVCRNRDNVIRKTLARIAALAEENEVGLIVVGLPLNMDGSEGERAAAARDFGKKVENRTGLPVVFHDERLTTVSAEEALREMGVPASEQKRMVDQVAACLILRDFLENRREEIPGP